MELGMGATKPWLRRAAGTQHEEEKATVPWQCCAMFGMGGAFLRGMRGLQSQSKIFGMMELQVWCHCSPHKFGQIFLLTNGQFCFKGCYLFGRRLATTSELHGCSSPPVTLMHLAGLVEEQPAVFVA